MAINFRQHSKGNWEYRIRFRDPFTGKSKESSKRGFKSKAEARKAGQEMEQKLLHSYEETMDTSLLREFLNDWLYEYKKDVVRKNTFEIHRRNIENHIIPYFKNIKLKDVKPIMYQKFLNHLYNQGYSKRTREIIHGTMRGAMEKAYHLRKIDRNPCIGSTMKGEDKEKQIKFIDSSDIPLFLSEAFKYGYEYWIFYKFMIETGVRKGEAAALQWNNVDLKDKTVKISQTLDFQASEDRGEDLFGDPKTYRSKRVISISHSLTNDLHFLLKHQNQNKMALNDIYRHDLNLVLCRKDGSPMPKSSLFNSFSRILGKSNLPKLPIHSLRHTHAVLLMEAGTDMKYIQERLGHGSMQITADVYSHISKKIDQSSMRKYEEYMNDIFS